jgi:hypothetical protein
MAKKIVSFINMLPHSDIDQLLSSLKVSQQANQPLSDLPHDATLPLPTVEPSQPTTGLTPVTRPEITLEPESASNQLEGLEETAFPQTQPLLETVLEEKRLEETTLSPHQHRKKAERGTKRELLSFLSALPRAEKQQGFVKNRQHIELSESNSQLLRLLLDTTEQKGLDQWNTKELVNYLVIEFFEKYKNDIQLLS